MLQALGLPGAAIAALFFLSSAVAAQSPEPLRLKIVGGLAGVSQFTNYEEPFWRDVVPRLTGGRVQAEIVASDRAGIRSQEMLPLIRLGVVPFGTALLAVISTEEPEFNAMDLPILNPTIADLRRTTALFRPFVESALRERYGVRLLAIYTYPAQVVWCNRPFSSLGDLRGRRVRTSSVGQADLIAAVGGTAVVTPFREIVSAMRAGVFECAITGTLSGNAIGLHEVTTHVHALAINWGVSIFAANEAAWDALPEDIRTILAEGIASLEREIWDAAERETGLGLACAAGLPACTTGRRGHLTVVPASPADEARRLALFTGAVLPRWIDRCGPTCAEVWNTTLAPALGIRAPVN
ncbi:MAG: TRAP transporter substrate-binding protein [Acetobacteraceae bacterium]|nr:TRAP transporter substrate-binding protein [Acetobacteraceae bacterium]